MEVIVKERWRQRRGLLFAASLPRLSVGPGIGQAEARCQSYSLSRCLAALDPPVLLSVGPPKEAASQVKQLRRELEHYLHHSARLQKVILISISSIYWLLSQSSFKSGKIGGEATFRKKKKNRNEIKFELQRSSLLVDLCGILNFHMIYFFNRSNTECKGKRSLKDSCLHILEKLE